jgi:hypothetical protein
MSSSQGADAETDADDDADADADDDADADADDDDDADAESSAKRSLAIVKMGLRRAMRLSKSEYS